MSVFKKDVPKIDPDLYTDQSERQMRMHYDAYVYKGRMNIQLRGEYGVHGESEDPAVVEMNDIPLDIFERAITKDKFKKVTGKESAYFHPSEWTLVLAKADNPTGGLDAAILTNFELAVIELNRLQEAVNRLYPYNKSEMPAELGHKLKASRDEVERFRAMLLGIKEIEAEGERWEWRQSLGPSSISQSTL